eukprot:TRINITY_DN4849_c0_g1_i1.p1 TRINITY_DN4849_c0_g1~~TRINITY_DN4849_c0_g1_i1.p1  ORF type:complete len:318 (-),score=23.58 TRINITY_DN4849_c0_g1_i1:261-1097(-)
MCIRDRVNASIDAERWKKGQVLGFPRAMKLSSKLLDRPSSPIENSPLMIKKIMTQTKRGNVKAEVVKLTSERLKTEGSDCTIIDFEPRKPVNVKMLDKLVFREQVQSAVRKSIILRSMEKKGVTSIVQPQDKRVEQVLEGVSRKTLRHKSMDKSKSAAETIAVYTRQRGRKASADGIAAHCHANANRLSLLRSVAFGRVRKVLNVLEREKEEYASELMTLAAETSANRTQDHSPHAPLNVRRPLKISKRARTNSDSRHSRYKLSWKDNGSFYLQVHLE